MADKSDKRKSVSKVVWKGDAESFPYFNSQIRSYAISKGAVYNAVLNGKDRFKNGATRSPRARYTMPYLMEKIVLKI